MKMPYGPKIAVNGGEYFPPPYSIQSLSPTVRHGLIPVALLAMLSVASTLSLIGFLGYRFATWRTHYRTFVGYNQYVVLVLNLLLADLQQASAFLISFHWVHKDYILAPHPACFAQGWLLHSGDVSSAFFVLAIAVHTFYTAVYGMRVGSKTFTAGIVAIWVFSYFLTGVGVGLHGQKYFVGAGAWCWVSSEYEDDRLALHYIWLFIAELGTVIIYFITFFQLRAKTRQLFPGQRVGHNHITVEAVNRITKLMTLYPCVYIVLTLPLSVGRMWSMAHHGRPIADPLAIAAAALLTSCGWIDSLLYTLTRKALLRDTMPGGSIRRHTTASDHWAGTELGGQGKTPTRTVTVDDCQVSETIGPQDKTPAVHHSPSSSIDPILGGGGTGNKTEPKISVQMQAMLDLDEVELTDNLEKANEASAAPSYHQLWAKI